MFREPCSPSLSCHVISFHPVQQVSDGGCVDCRDGRAKARARANSRGREGLQGRFRGRDGRHLLGIQCFWWVGKQSIPHTFIGSAFAVLYSQCRSREREIEWRTRFYLSSVVVSGVRNGESCIPAVHHHIPSYPIPSHPIPACKARRVSPCAKPDPYVGYTAACLENV